MEQNDRDLGFFNGIKTELITLVAGFALFSLLVDTLINHIGDFFSVDVETSTKLFVWFYFIAPVVCLLIWILLINYKAGLKKIILKRIFSKTSILVLI